ncbi:MAG: EamA family transporter, partial [Proteobacteria bacterium]|nr:EamA family transporter [Pseudomonadota bacterium]
MRLSGIAAILVTVFLWGNNFVAAKIAVTDVPPLFVTALRFLILAGALSPFLKIPAGTGKRIVEYALVMGIGHFGTMFYAIRFMDVSTAAITLQTTTPFTVLLAWLMLGERFGPWRMAGLAMAFGGVVVLVGGPGGVDALMPLLMLVFAALMWAVGNVRSKQMPDVPIFSQIAWMALIGCPALAGMSWFTETGQLAALQDAEFRFWAALVYMTIASSIVAYGLWYYLLKTYDVTRIAPYNLL